MKRWLLIVVCSVVLCGFGCQPAEDKPATSAPAAGGEAEKMDDAGKDAAEKPDDAGGGH